MDCCIADGCRKYAEKDRKYCHGHRKREKQKRPIDTPLREWGMDADDYLDSKAIELGAAKDDSDRAFKLAQKRLRYAAVRYVKKLLARQKVPRPTDDTSRG